MMNKDNFIIDDITWNDLSMEEIFSRLDKAHSSVGSEYLKTSLKTLEFDNERLRKRNQRIIFFEENEKSVKILTKQFKALGKTKKVSFLDYIFKLKDVPKRNNLLHYILIILLILSVILIFIKPVLGIVAFVVMIAINIIIYFKLKAKIEGYFICLKYLVSMVVCAKAIINSKQIYDPSFDEISENLNDSFKTFSGLKRGSWLITNSVSGSLIDVIMDYIRMIFHVDLIKFNSMRNKAIENEDKIKILYDTLGEIEMNILIADFRRNLPFYVEPSFYAKNDVNINVNNTLIAEDVYHPLINDPVLNSIHTENSVLITGSNASGKSTFLKTIAINQIFSQTIYTCLAKKFLTTFYKVMSSMALSDNLLGKESYFIVEIKSLKRIFDETGQRPVMCFIDEVLRGTNTIERISASSEILSSLSAKNTLVFAATHDIELTELLKDEMKNYHFSERIENGEVVFDYKIKSGATDSSNAIKLLDSFGFDEDIVMNANKRSNDFKATGVWK